MITAVQKPVLVAIYAIAAIMAYPILLYMLQDIETIHDVFPLLPEHAFIQVFLSGPVLIGVGGVLRFRLQQRRAGWVCMLIGLSWIGAIFVELITKN